MKRITSVLLVCLAAAPLFAGEGRIRRATEPVSGSYVVILEHTLAGRRSLARAEDLVKRHGGTVLAAWDDAVKGFAVRMTEQQAFALSHDPDVATVEEDGIAHIQSSQSADLSRWNLDRIDQRGPAETPTTDYLYNYCNTGVGVMLYSLDSGVRADHVEFRTADGLSSRVVAGVDYVQALYGVRPGDSGTPCGGGVHTPGDAWRLNGGHGTAVASIAGGRTFGVAKDVSITPIRVVDCDGTSTTARIVAGFDYAANDHTLHPSQPAVMNVSLAIKLVTSHYTASDMTAIDNAANGAIDAGIIVVAGAGNEDAPTMNYSPQRVPGVINVGGTTRADERWIATAGAVGSNYGALVDLFAPATNIRSAAIDSYTAERPAYSDGGSPVRNGTSFAAPHVAGIVAQYLEVNPTATVDTVTTWLLANATANAISTVNAPLRGSPNLLAYSYCVTP